MSDPLESLHLKLPYLAAAQAQKHVTHNEALRRLDSLVQLAVLDSALADPPAEPDEGDRYIVAAGGTGAWADHDGAVASFIDGAWDFDAPEDGWLAFDIAAGVLLAHQSSGWDVVSGVPAMVDFFGIHATADETNRLAVKSEVVLFSGIDTADGGTGDIRFIVNKEADGDTASLLFQSGWSGRAEVGLCGDTDFVFKVSADGETWIDAIRVDKDTGLATLIYDNSVSGLTATTVQDAIDEVAAGGGGGGSAVVSVFGRTGTVTAAAGDYAASAVTNDSGVAGTHVDDALDALDAGKLDAATYTAADVLTKVKTVDGTSSGLDADLLDGSEAAAFARLATLASQASGDGAALIGIADGGGIITATTVEGALAEIQTAVDAVEADYLASGDIGSAVQAYDADLAALAGLAATGLVARTGAGTAAARTLAGSNGVAVANGDGVSGNPTVALDVNGLTEDASPDTANDYVATYDASAGAHKKVRLTNLGTGGGGGGERLVGEVIDYAGSSAPSGWLLCYGQNVSRSTYAGLFAVIGTTFGTGDGSTTFGIPDLRGRVTAGKDDMGGSAASRLTSGNSGITGTTLGSAGGDERLHGHSHVERASGGGGSSGLYMEYANGRNPVNDATMAVSTASTGSGSAQNVQPTMIVNKIIYAGV